MIPVSLGWFLEGSGEGCSSKGYIGTRAVRDVADFTYYVAKHFGDVVSACLCVCGGVHVYTVGVHVYTVEVWCAFFVALPLCEEGYHTVDVCWLR